MTMFNVSYSVFTTAATALSVFYTDTPDGYFAVCGSETYLYFSNITDAADVSNFIANILPTATSVGSQDDALASASLSYLTQIKKYDIQTTVMYIGSAKPGTATSSTGWTIKKFTLSGGNVTGQQRTKVDAAVWDDRTTESYFG